MAWLAYSAYRFKKMMTMLAFLFLLVAAVGSTVSAAASFDLEDTSLSSSSAAGRALLSKARKLENNNNYYTSWMEGYSIKFAGCSSFPQFEQNDENSDGMRNQLLAKFYLCPSNKCSTCRRRGEYVVEMRDFIEAYSDAQAEANEYACETQQANCETECQYNDDADNCEYQCLYDAGMSYCSNSGDQNNNGMDMNELSECRNLNEGNNDNNNNNYQSSSQNYYVGAYCKGTSVYAGVFKDSMCTKHANSDVYKKKTGYSLPTDPLVTGKCLPCGASSNNNNNNNNGGNVLETCTDLYQDAAKCESKLKDSNIQYKDTSSCDFIHKTLPRVNKASMGGVRASVVLAWIFGLLCLGLVGYIGYAHYKNNKNNVELSSMGFFGGQSQEPQVVQPEPEKKKGWFT